MNALNRSGPVDHGRLLTAAGVVRNLWRFAAAVISGVVRNLWRFCHGLVTDQVDRAAGRKDASPVHERKECARPKDLDVSDLGPSQSFYRSRNDCI